MAITGGFGTTMDLERGTMRRWVMGRDGVKRWADTNDPVEPMRGANIKATMRHDAGAYARCSYCGRYSDNANALGKDKWPCECGKLHGWSGSFVAPTAASQWSEVTPNVEVQGQDEAQLRTVPLERPVGGESQSQQHGEKG